MQSNFFSVFQIILKDNKRYHILWSIISSLKSGVWSVPHICTVVCSGYPIDFDRIVYESEIWQKENFDDLFSIGCDLVFCHYFGQSFESIVHIYGSVWQKQYRRLFFSGQHLYRWVVSDVSSKHRIRHLCHDIQIGCNRRSFSNRTRKSFEKSEI